MMRRNAAILTLSISFALLTTCAAPPQKLSLTDITPLKSQPTSLRASAPARSRAEEIVRALGKPAQRERAIKELDALDISFLPELKIAAPKVTDMEALKLVSARIYALEIEETLACPPISLEVKDATLEETVAALRKAVKTPFGIYNGSKSDRPPHFTCSLENVSFWEAIARLDSQNAISWFSLGGTSQFAEWDRNPVSRLAPVGPGAMGYSDIKLFYITPRPMTQPFSTMTIVSTAAIDPRVPVIAFRGPYSLSAKDSDGKEYVEYSGPIEKEFKDGIGTWSNGQDTLEYPAVVPKTLTVRAIFDVRLLVEGPSLQFDLSKPVPKDIDIGGLRFHIDLQPKEGNNQYRIEVHNESKIPPFDKHEPWLVEFLDSQGVPIGKAVGRMIVAHLNEEKDWPVTVRITVPKRTRDVEIPLLFKDVPVKTK